MRLRALEPEDLELLYSIENDPSLWDSSNADGPYSRYALKRYIAEAAPIYESGELRLAVEVTPRPDGEAQTIGVVDLTRYDARSARAEVGLALLREFRGRGYGRRSLALLEAFARTRLRIHSLHAFVLPGNEPSCRLFRSAGYQEVASLPDWHFSQGRYEATTLFVKIISET